MAALTPAEKRLDRAFSKWVRHSNAKKGYCKCVTCPHIDTPERMDAGHYIDRTHKATRWDERNVWPQCTNCNRFHEGMKDEYALYLVKKYGADILAELNKAKWTPFKMNDLQALEMAKDYERKVKELYG